MYPSPVRSALFAPALNARALEKARALPCDRVIIDLEDSVGPGAKDEARAAALAAIAGGNFASGQPMLRVNGTGTSWHARDLAAAAGSSASAVLLPKLDSAGMLRTARTALGPGMPLWAMIESCTAVLDIARICAEGVTSGLAGLIVGPNDLAREMHARPGPDRQALLPALGMVVMAARAHGLTVLDGVYNDFRDADGLTAECAQGAALGFDGKSLIHPGQIAIANAAFGPTPDELRAARAIVAAFALPENSGKGVISLDGRMVELLHLEQARHMLARAGDDSP